MKKNLLTIITVTVTFFFANAQQVIELPYSKEVNKTNGKWGKWDSKWNSEVENAGASPMLIIKKVNTTSFSILYVSNFPESMTGVFENVIYDPVKTSEIRDKNSNPNLNAYKFVSSSKHLWTENITLEGIYSSQSKWNTTNNAKIYLRDDDSVLLYSSGASLSANQINDDF